VSFTVVFLHAHPDDEAILTGGTMAKLADEGHRVVLVTATAGEPGGSLASIRSAELAESAKLLGCARVEMLGYADSGMDAGSAPPDSFSRIAPEGPAERLASILREERADMLVGYDPAGGYGHPDHVQVHRVARIASSSIAPVPLLLEATVDRRALRAAVAVGNLVRRRGRDLTPPGAAGGFADPSAITHAVNVTRFAGIKRSAIAAHASQGTADSADRSLAWLVRLPMPVFRLAMGREWFTEVGRRRRPGQRRLGDPLASLRGGTDPGDPPAR